MASTNAHTTSSSGEVMHFSEENRDLDHKSNPGYFPAWIGQSLQDGRYTIMCKLGWGQQSTVWLARDLKLDRFVSLKILTCKAAEDHHSNKSDEIGLMKKLAASDSSHPGSRHVIEYLDTFEFDGPKGRHCCIVAEVLGFSLGYLRKENNADDCHRISLPLVKTIIKQLLLGLDYLHTSCGIVHADLKHDNILFRPDDIPSVVAQDSMDEPSRSHSYGTAVRPPVVPVKTRVLSLSTNPPGQEAKAIDLVIADFGDSHWRNHHFQEKIQSYALRAPEVILGSGWDTPADIWSLGCLIVEFLVGGWLFEPNRQPTWDVAEDHLARMTESLEEQFPLDMLEKSEHRSKYFNEDGTFAHFTTHLEPNWTFDMQLRKFSSFSDDEKEIASTVKFLKRCMRLRPEDRASAKDLLNDDWLA